MSTPAIPAPADLAAPERFVDPAAPLITYYDGGTGERTELSARTFANWVAKTASFGTDLAGLMPGDGIDLRLRPHWLGAVWVAAALRAGWRLGGDDARVVVDEASLPDTPAADGDAVAVSTLPLSRAFGADLPAGAEDYSAEVSGCADVFSPLPAAPTVGEAHARLLAGAAGRAAGLGLTSSARLLIGANPAVGDGRELLLATLITTSSLVVVHDTAAADRERLAGVENVTHRAAL